MSSIDKVDRDLNEHMKGLDETTKQGLRDRARRRMAKAIAARHDPEGCHCYADDALLLFVESIDDEDARRLVADYKLVQPTFWYA